MAKYIFLLFFWCWRNSSFNRAEHSFLELHKNYYAFIMHHTHVFSLKIDKISISLIWKYNKNHYFPYRNLIINSFLSGMKSAHFDLVFPSFFHLFLLLLFFRSAFEENKYLQDIHMMALCTVAFRDRRQIWKWPGDTFCGL